MAIAESQLEVWAQQGSVPQSKSTYGTVKAVLESRAAPYFDLHYSTFLQGSYCNDTNVFAESDVDIVCCLHSTYYYDVNPLSNVVLPLLEAGFIPAPVSYDMFKSKLLSHLRANFGNAVEPAKKAIFIGASGARREVDVLLAAEYRKYYNWNQLQGYQYIEGVCFWTSSGERIVNYPKQHSENCTAKHQATGGYFKPTVRILKNFRNRMADRGLIERSIAPSYFIECMLFNVPTYYFGGTYTATVIGCLNWLAACDRTSLQCANGMYRLFGSDTGVTWNTADFDRYLSAIQSAWNNWS